MAALVVVVTLAQTETIYSRKTAEMEWAITRGRADLLTARPELAAQTEGMQGLAQLAAQAATTAAQAVTEPVRAAAVAVVAGMVLILPAVVVVALAAQSLRALLGKAA